MRASRRDICFGLGLTVVSHARLALPARAAVYVRYRARIDGAALWDRALDLVLQEVRDVLRGRGIPYAALRRDGGSIRVALRDVSTISDGMATLSSVARKRFALDAPGFDIDLPRVELNWSGHEAQFAFASADKGDVEAEATRQSLPIMRRRLRALGLRRARASLGSASRILLEVPSALDPLQRLALAGAEVTFHELRHDVSSDAADVWNLPPGTVRVRAPLGRPKFIGVSLRPLGTLAELDRALLGTDGSSGQPLVVLPPRGSSYPLYHRSFDEPHRFLVAVVRDQALATGRVRSVGGGIELGHDLAKNDLPKLLRALEALSLPLPAPLAVRELRE